MARTHGSAQRAHGRAARARLAGAALVLVAGAALSGCSGSAPQAAIDSAAASAEYQPAVDDLVAALQTAYPTVIWTADSETRVTAGDADGGGCSLALGTMRADPSLPDTAGTWADVLTVVNPVLSEHDFPAITDEDSLDGGWSGVSSHDDAGAELRLADKAYTLLTLSVPVTDTDC